MRISTISGFLAVVLAFAAQPFLAQEPLLVVRRVTARNHDAVEIVCRHRVEESFAVAG
jgi:hypothetical protein